MATIKKKRISVHAQGGMLRHYFPDSTLKIIGFDRGFVWEGKLKPSNLSITYDIMEKTDKLTPLRRRKLTP